MNILALYAISSVGCLMLSLIHAYTNVNSRINNYGRKFTVGDLICACILSIIPFINILCSVLFILDLAETITKCELVERFLEKPIFIRKDNK